MTTSFTVVAVPDQSVMKLHPVTYFVGVGLTATHLSFAAFPDCVNGPLKSNKVCDVTETPANRASALVQAMQPNEKLQNIIRYVARDSGNSKDDFNHE